MKSYIRDITRWPIISGRCAWDLKANRTAGRGGGMIMSRHRAETNYSRPIKVSFADLTHTGQLVATNAFPLGISMVAAYARKELGAEIEFEIFRIQSQRLAPCAHMLQPWRSPKERHS